jgi:hypothetical protein
MQSDSVLDRKEKGRNSNPQLRTHRKRMGRRKKISMPKELWYKVGNSQPTRIQSRYARINPPPT